MRTREHGDRLRSSPRLAAIVVIAALVLAPASRALAQDPYRCIDSLSDDEVRQRLRWIERRFDAGRRRSQAHWYSWFAIALGSAAFGWFRFANAETRVARDTGLFAGLGSLGLVGMITVMPLSSAFATRRLARAPRGTPEARRAALVFATHLLERSAAREGRRAELESHLLPAVWAVGTGTYQLVRNHGEKGVGAAAALAFAMPFVVTELRLWTHPHQAIADFASYRAWACAGSYVPRPDEELPADLAWPGASTEGAHEAARRSKPAPDFRVGPLSFALDLRF